MAHNTNFGQYATQQLICSPNLIKLLDDSLFPSRNYQPDRLGGLRSTIQGTEQLLCTRLSLLKIKPNKSIFIQDLLPLELYSISTHFQINVLFIQNRLSSSKTCIKKLHSRVILCKQLKIFY